MPHAVAVGTEPQAEQDLVGAGEDHVDVVVAQLLGLAFSIALGMTPDNPFPDGSVNRVVRGVTIHPLTPSAARGEE